MSTKHCLLPWIVRHAARTVNRYVIHSDGYTRIERRWGRNYESPTSACAISVLTRLSDKSVKLVLQTTLPVLPAITRQPGFLWFVVRDSCVERLFVCWCAPPRAICEFGETLLHLPPQHKKLPKADLRMQKCIWLGKVSETGENYVAPETGVQKVRTVRRLQPDFKYDHALLNKVSTTPGAPRRNTYNPSFATLLDTQLQSSEKRRATQDFGQQTNVTDDIFHRHRRQVHDHYRLAPWPLHQPDGNIHHYQHHLDKHYDA